VEGSGLISKGDKEIDHQPTVSERPGWKRLALFLFLAAAGCAADLYTKQVVFEWRGLPQPGVDNTWWLWKDYVGIQTAVNQGAVFGLGQGGSVWFAVLSITAAIGIIYWLFIRGAARDLVLTIALGCVTGGILGNLHDRLGLWHGPTVAAHFRHGVRDWILFCYREHTWPNFNIADSLLVCGAIALVCHAFWPRKAENPKRLADPDEPPTHEKPGKTTEKPARKTAATSPS
jgi:signal peptidase II